MKTIELTQGKVVLIDACDFESLSQWKWYAKHCPDGRRATKSSKYYAARTEIRKRGPKAGKKKEVYMHRFLMDAPKGKVVDHRNGDGLDNRRQNLRICTQKENLANGVNGERDVFDEAIERAKSIC